MLQCINVMQDFSHRLFFVALGLQDLWASETFGFWVFRGSGVSVSSGYFFSGFGGLGAYGLGDVGFRKVGI